MNTIWSFDLGKASVGEAVREKNKPHFLHKASLLIPAELARRGPAWVSGTPASKNRALQTRKAHKRREHWLDEVWSAAGLTPLVRKTVELTGFRVKKVKKLVRGKVKWKQRKVGGTWTIKTDADPRLGKEFGEVGDPECYTSCLLRIKLLGGESLAEWQIYKALFSAIQKRGYGDVPWKKQRKADGADKNEAKEAEENALKGLRWREFEKRLDAAKLGNEYRRACYFDAEQMQLWNPAQSKQVALYATERPESTRNIVFPADAIMKEVLVLAAQAAVQLPLSAAYDKVMAGYRAQVAKRIDRVNAHRKRIGKSEVKPPDFLRKANDFAELLAFGPGGKATVRENVRPIASYDAEIRKATGLRPGGPDDAMGVLSQEVARFDNRLRADCALIPRLSVCRNLAPEERKKIKEHDHERLLPAQVTFLMQLQNLWVEGWDEKRTQRKLETEEIAEIFEKQNPGREYSLTPTEWKAWCKHFKVSSVLNMLAKTKDDDRGESDDSSGGGKKKYVVAPPAPSGRGRFSRPALRILKELLLRGDTPSAFCKRLTSRDAELLNKMNLDVLDTEPTVEGKDKNGNAFTNYEKRSRPWVLVSDLQFLGKMRNDDGEEKFFIPTQQLDRLAQEANSTRKARDTAIRQLIGMQNNPIVRHRLETFWERLRYLECKAPNGEQEGFGVPERIVLEFVRDDSETSWLGPEATKDMIKAQTKQRERRDNARKRLAELGDANGDVRKYLLWEAQGSQCLYTGDLLPFTNFASYRVDHIVPRAQGGPDAFSNLVLTTDETNARKGDWTPWQWFQQNQMKGWDAYKGRVDKREREIGGRKHRLLLSAEAEKLVERYTPLAETAWIARLAQTVAGLHFGWANGCEKVSDGRGGSELVRRVIPVSGGLTGRVRRKYLLNSLLGDDRELDVKITATLDALAALRTSSLSREARKVQGRALSAELDELRTESEEKKNRRDKRHHALDAMILNFLAGWVNDPKLEEEFRFTDLGDTPCFPPEKMAEKNERRRQIIARGIAAEKASTPEARERLQREITALWDAIAEMRERPDPRVVRAAFRRELYGDAANKIAPVLPWQLNFQPVEMEAGHYRAAWLRVEDDKPSADPEHFGPVMKVDRMPVVRLASVRDWKQGGEKYSTEHGQRMANELVAHESYDVKQLSRLLRDFLAGDPSEAEWAAFCASDAVPVLLKPKKAKGDPKDVLVYRLQEKLIKRSQLTPSTRASLYSLGVGSKEELRFVSDEFLLRVGALVLRPDKEQDKADIPIEPDTSLQETLRALLPRLQEHYRQFPPTPPKRPRLRSEIAVWEQRKTVAEAALEKLLEEVGVKPKQGIYFRADADDIKKRRYRMGRISSVFLTKARAFSVAEAQRNAESIADLWTRFQVREFLKRLDADAETEVWAEFCGAFVQVEKDALKEFLATKPETAEQFIAFYRSEAEKRNDLGAPKTQRILAVHCIEGDPTEYFDSSKDGSGIYARGKNNRGYFMWKATTCTDGIETVKFGAEPVRIYEKSSAVKERIHARPGVELYDEKMWRTNLLLHLPNPVQSEKSGETLLNPDYYYFASISTEPSRQRAELRLLVSGETTGKVYVHYLLKAGLHRVALNENQ